MHYVLDDARANEESIYFQQRDRLKVVSPEEEGGEEKRQREELASVLGPISPVSTIQADLRGFALEKICGGENFRAVLIDPPWSISMALPFPSLRDGEIESLKIARFWIDRECVMCFCGRRKGKRRWRERFCKNGRRKRGCAW